MTSELLPMLGCYLQHPWNFAFQLARNASPTTLAAASHQQHPLGYECFEDHFAIARLAFHTSLSWSLRSSHLRCLGSRSCRSKSSRPARARSRIASNSVIDSSHSPRFAILSRALSLLSHIRRSLNSTLSSNHSSPSSAVILTIANTSSIGISHSVA